MTAGSFAIAETSTSRAGHRLSALAFVAGQFSKLPFKLIDILHRQQFEIFIDAVRVFAWTPGATVGLDLFEYVIANLERNPTPTACSDAARRFSFALALCALPVAGIGPALFVCYVHCFQFPHLCQPKVIIKHV
ncbi:hypothetical protein JEM67_20925 [Serratia sp. PAMC26656]|uniref:hypothetical protein n=1 Tax=Serratia sp. PAMC26656 TaxID=2775909 RepID=UPI0018F62756|nr:hypothetical protein [Serratia sp. PAMC26656]MBJ7892225.1 hypothetical protein [Serratia sp. PAMC26656]